LLAETSDGTMTQKTAEGKQGFSSASANLAMRNRSVFATRTATSLSTIVRAIVVAASSWLQTTKELA
jgi:hypothetical protein